MHDRPKQVLPLPSKRASVARPTSNALNNDDDHDDMSSTDDDENHDESGDGSMGNLLCETRNLALGLSDTSSTGSLASGPSRGHIDGLSGAPPPPRPVPPIPTSPSETMPPPPPPIVPIDKPLPPSPEASPIHRPTSTTLNATYKDTETQAMRNRSDRSKDNSERQNNRDNDRQRDSNVDRRQHRDSQGSSRANRSSLIENQAKSPSDLLQNIEPYDVLFLSNTQTPPPRSNPPSLVSSTPDVTIPAPRNILPPPLPPPSRNHRHSTHIASVRVNSKIIPPSLSEHDAQGTTSRWKVSAKIQQLLNTLKKPKRRPLPEFYEDDDKELEIAANNKDPSAPLPEGSAMSPAVGPQLEIPAGLPRNLEAAIQRYGSATYKAPVATVLDPNGKLSITLSYGKLLSRSLKIAYTLLNKIGLNNKTGESQVKPGDRIALVYPNNDPLNMICAFYGCVMAGAVPVPIEVPITRRDAGSQQIGFLLGMKIMIQSPFYCCTMAQ